MMSANITAASTSCRRTGCSVTSAQSSGRRGRPRRSVWRSRIARYSGSERPAWRMNQTGVRSTASRRAARTRSGLAHRRTRASPGIVQRVGEHPVPAGPLAVALARLRRSAVPRRRDRDCARRAGERGHGDLALARRARRAGSPTTGSTPSATRSSGTARAPRCRAPVAPGETVELELARRGAAAAGPLPARLRPRRGAPLLVRRGRRARRSRSMSRSRRGSPSARLAVVVHGGADPATTAALAAQEEPVVERRRGRGRRTPRRGRRARRPTGRAALLDAHAEGWAAVGTAVDRRPATARRSRPWAPGGGRNPRFGAAAAAARRCSTASSRASTTGLPAYAGGGRACSTAGWRSDFDCDPVVDAS